MSTSIFTQLLSSADLCSSSVLLYVVVEVLFYVHRNRRFIRDGSPGRPPRLSHSTWALPDVKLESLKAPGHCLSGCEPVWPSGKVLGW